MSQNMKKKSQNMKVSGTKNVGEEISMTMTNEVLGACNQTNVFTLVAIELGCF